MNLNSVERTDQRSNDMTRGELASRPLLLSRLPLKKTHPSAVRTAPAKRNITEGVIWRQLLAFAFPILLSNLLQQFYNTADLLIVGRYAGKAAMAAVGATGTLTGLIIGLFVGLSTGASVVLAQYYGAEDGRMIYKTVHTAIALALIAGLILTALGIFGTPFFLRWMKTPEDALADAIIYLQIYFSASIPGVLYNYGSSLLRAVGDSRRPLYFLAVSVVTNIILDLLFVAVFRWGVVGAAVATGLAQILAAFLTILSLMKADTSYRLFWRELRLDRMILKRILHIGIPCGIQGMMVSFSTVIIQAQINTFGSAATAGAAASGRIDGFVYMPMNACGLAATTFTGQNLGAKKIRRIEVGAYLSLIMAMGTGLVLGSILMHSLPFWIGLFSSEADVLHYGVTMLSYFTSWYWLFAVGEVMSGIIRGAGRAQAPMLLSLLWMTIFRLFWLLGLMRIWPSYDLLSACYPVSWGLMALSIALFFFLAPWIPNPAAQGEGLSGTKRWVRLAEARQLYPE